MWLLVGVDEFSSGFGAVGVAVDSDDLGVMDEAVDECGGDDVVGEDFAPTAEWHVRGDQNRALFVATGNELEEQVGGVGVEWEVADLVDDDQSVAAEPFEFGGQAAGGVCLGQVWFPRNRGGLLYAASGSVTAVFS